MSELPPIIDLKMALCECEATGCDEQPTTEFKDHTGSLLLCRTHANELKDEFAAFLAERHRAYQFGREMRELWALSDD